MEPFIPDRQTFLAKPSRVSRLYPLIALVLSVASSGLTYAFLETRITRDSAVASRDGQIVFLENQVKTLTEQQKSDQASLKEANEKLAAATSKLESTTATLAEKEKTLASTLQQIQNQEAQLTNNASELEKLRNRPPLFSIKSVVANSERDESVKKLITDAYDTISEVYGKPYALNQITISFVDSLSIAQSAGETTIESGPNGVSITIRLLSFDPNNFQDVNTVIHEVIHGFHGYAVFDSSAFEEGITVAATDMVMDRMTALGKIAINQRYIGINQTQYTNWNSDLQIPQDNNLFYSNSNVGKIYQVLGYAWRELAKEDSDIFIKLNEAYYKDVQSGKTPTNALIKNHIASLIQTVSGENTASWMAKQTAFNPQ